MRKTSTARGAFTVLLATTGFCGMALEILLIIVYQNLYGCVYTRIGLVVGLFMLGLVAGAPVGRMLAQTGRMACWIGMACSEVLLLSLAISLPAVSSAPSVPNWLLGLLVWLAGLAVGTEFPPANRLLTELGGSLGRASAITDSADHLGAALGSLLVGVLLVPIMGVAASGKILAAVKLAGLLVLAAAGLLIEGGSSRSPKIVDTSEEGT